MPFMVRSYPSHPRGWRIQFYTEAKGKRKTRDIPEHEYARLGFAPSMTIEEARAVRDKLMAQERVSLREAKREAIRERIEAQEDVYRAYLNAMDVEEFERRVLFEDYAPRELERLRTTRIASHWRMAQEIIVSIALPPKEWAERKKTFYGAFASRKISPDYAVKILRVINLWGEFVAQKEDKFFRPVPVPRGFQKEKIADRFRAKGKTNESDPLTPSMLEATRSKLSEDLYRWFLLSIWFGLRPKEVDALKDPARYRIESEGGVPLLWVYQPKLGAIAEKKRWKYIPCMRPEQVECLEIIRAGNFKRVSHSRFLKTWFKANVTSYGGRKGFEALMGSFGYGLEDIALWMGHQSIERTWRSYKDKQKVRIPVPSILKQAKEMSPDAAKVLEQMRTLLAEFQK